MQNFDCSICGSTSFTEVGGLPVCEYCFYSIQENDYSMIEIKVDRFRSERALRDSVDMYDFDKIKEVVYEHLGITPKNELIKSRKREVVLPRQLCHHFSIKFTKKTYAEIGKHFGNKDHATVLYSDKTIKNLKETDKVFRQEYNKILAKF